MPELLPVPTLNGRELVSLPNSQATLSVIPGRAVLRLRLPMIAVGQACAALPGLLPAKALSATSGDAYALWTAPDTWLLVGQDTTAFELQQLISAPLKDILHAGTDLGDALVILCLQGPAAPDVLSRGCGLDFSPGAFSVGHCSSTQFARFPLLIHKTDESNRFELYVDRSYAAALWDWLVEN